MQPRLTQGSLSGVVASFALSWWLGAELPSRYQLAGAGIIMVALMALMASTALAFLRSTRRVLQRVFLFVCGGN